EPAPASAANESPLSPVSPPHVPPARPYQDTQAEELDVPDFLK
ncbi:cell division protein FtsZ, partial [Streptomyces sp. ZEA17I]